ncbi:tail fiber protein [Escherichia coli]|nr:tail fiber protein [Escherichia coli]
MFYIDNDSGVTVMPPVSAQRSAIVRWFSEGDGNNVITWPGMDWFNIVQAELLNTLEEAGIQPDKTKLNQLALSIKAIMSNNALLIKNNLSEIKIAGASAQRTARENLDIYDASLNKKGLVQLTSATDSLSETLAATAKAVKIAMDNANARLAKDRNGADIPNKPLFIQNLGLQETINKASGALQKNQNGADIPGKDTFAKNTSAARAFSGSYSTEGGNWTTAQFIEWLDSVGAFNHPYWMCKGSWSYANNKLITDTGCGNIHLAGAVIEVMGIKSAMTIRITTPTTSSGGGATSAQFTYINHGDNYAPGWRRDWNRYGDSMSGTINQDSGSQNAYMSTALCSGTRGGKKYLRKFRGGGGDTIWHETVQGGVIRWATGNYDAQEELSLSSAYGLRSRGEITSLSANGLRVAYGNYGFFIRNDGKDSYFMLTASGDRFGSWNNLRALTINNANGAVSIGHGLNVTGRVNPSDYGNFDSRYVRDIRLGTRVVQLMSRGGRYEIAGHALTGLRIIGEVDGDDEAIFRPIQKYINGTWYNVAQV